MEPKRRVLLRRTVLFGIAATLLSLSILIFAPNLSETAGYFWLLCVLLGLGLSGFAGMTWVLEILDDHAVKHWRKVLHEREGE